MELDCTFETVLTACMCKKQSGRVRRDNTEA